MKKLLILLSVAVLSLGLVSTSSAYFAWNGHLYDVLLENENWFDARADSLALGPGWDLVSINSQEEQNFIAFLLASYGEAQFWAGGYQNPGQANPLDGWNWVSGEAWLFTSWAQVPSDPLYIEPNDWNGQNEMYLQLDGRLGRNWTWNDALITERVMGYVAESAVPEPTTLLLLGSGLLGLVGLRRKFKK